MGMALAQLPRVRLPAGRGGAYLAFSDHGDDSSREQRRFVICCCRTPSGVG